MSRKLPDDVASMLVFAVLAAIAKKPMTSRECARAILINESSVRGHIAYLERLGWIVRRARDNRWVMRVLLAPLEAPEPSGMESQRPKINPRREIRPVLGNALLKPLDAPGEEQKLLTAPDEEGQPGVPQDWRTAAERLAENWSLPLRLKGLDGELGVGKREPCVKCGKMCVTRYGDTVLCPKCGREWGETSGK